VIRGMEDNNQWNDTENNKDTEQLKIGYYACQNRYAFHTFDK